MKVTFDTNVLIYTLGLGNPRHAAAASLLARATRGDGVQTLQSLAECSRVLMGKLRFEPRRARREIDGSRTAFPVCSADMTDLDWAMKAVERHGLSFWDAMLWASAKRAGCPTLLSEDLQDGRRPGDVWFVNPFDPGNRRLVGLALPELRN